MHVRGRLDDRPRRAGPEPTPPGQFSVATYNINWNNRDLATLARTIRQANADLLCLQETNRQSESFLRRRLPGQYPHMHFQRGDTSASFGVLSKVPLEDVRFLPPRHGFFGTLLFRAELDGRKVQFANVHLQPTVGRSRWRLPGALGKSEAIRLLEMEYILASLPAGEPIILLGDFNSPSYLTVPRLLRIHGLVDSFAAGVPRPERHPTWQRPGARLRWGFRVDYVWHSRDIRTLTSRIMQSDASDHYLVRSSLAWAGAPASRTSRPVWLSPARLGLPARASVPEALWAPVPPH